VGNNAKQAMFPQGAEVIPNSRGTAPGFSLSVEGKLIFVIPGSSAEARMMLTQGVIPVLRKHFPQNEQYTAKQPLKTYGFPKPLWMRNLKILILPQWE